MDQKQNLRVNFTIWQKGHANSEGDPRDASTQAIPLDEGRVNESRYNESSNRCLAPDETHGVEAHQVSTDAEYASTINHKDEMDESLQCDILTQRQFHTVPGIERIFIRSQR